MRSCFLAFVLALPLAVYVHSQTSDSATTKASIHGTVIDAKTGQPLKGSEIFLRIMSAGNRSEANSAVSDADGRFSFDNLASGRYRLSATRNGYLMHDPRFASTRANIVVLSAGQSADVTLRLIPSAVIAGRVTSEADEPLPNVFVEAMKYIYQGDTRMLASAGSSTTNDRGEYRIWGLPPGKYYVRATHQRPGSTRPNALVYVPVFYPGVTDLSRTQALEVHPGDEVAGIDIAFVALRSVRVSGHVLNATSVPAKDAQVTLVGGAGSTAFTVGQATADAKGAFEIRGVPPGSYVLIAEQFGAADAQKEMRGRASIEVGVANVNDADVVTGPGTMVSGRVHVEGKAGVDLTKLSVALDAQDDLSSIGFTADVPNAAVGTDGTFAFRDVPEGNYYLKIVPLPDGYYLKPSGEGDAIEAGIKVGRNHGAAIEVVLSAGAGRITGTVTKDQQAAPSATVVLVPDAPRRGQSRLYRQSISDSGGRFTITNVPPGDYKLFAWEEIERGMYLDQDFLQSYEDSGKPLHVDDGANLSLQLDLIPGEQ